MKLNEIVENLSLEVLVDKNMEENIEYGYVCDLLSEVMGRAKANSLWITVHTNMNVVAVASMLDIKAIVVSEGRDPNETFLEKAKEEGIAVLKTKMNSFIITGKLYEVGIR